MKRTSYKRILISMPMNSQGAISALHGALECIRDEKTNEWSVHAGIECEQQRLDDLRHYDGALVHLADGLAQNAFLPSNHPPVVLFDSSISKDDAERLVREHSSLTVIVADFIAEGRCAARHFIERRFKNFAYVGDLDDSKREAHDRRIGFTDELQKNRLTCRTYRPSTPGKDAIPFSDEVPHLEKWLLSLPQNTALFVSGDARARDILALLIRNGVDVPEQMAVLGVGNDETLCNTSVPQLSSVDPNLHLLGCEAVKELDELMSGRGGRVFIHSPKCNVITRTSTSMDVIADPFVCKAVAWIQEHLSDRFDIAMVGRGINYPIKSLQWRFQKALGHSVGTEIKLRRLQRARTLRATTPKTLAEIADECGFCNASHLCNLLHATERT